MPPTFPPSAVNLERAWFVTGSVASFTKSYHRKLNTWFRKEASINRYSLYAIHMSVHELARAVRDPQLKATLCMEVIEQICRYGVMAPDYFPSAELYSMLRDSLLSCARIFSLGGQDAEAAKEWIEGMLQPIESNRLEYVTSGGNTNFVGSRKLQDGTWDDSPVGNWDQLVREVREALGKQYTASELNELNAEDASRCQRRTQVLVDEAEADVAARTAELQQALEQQQARGLTGRKVNAVAKKLSAVAHDLHVLKQLLGEPQSVQEERDANHLQEALSMVKQEVELDSPPAKKLKRTPQ